MPKSPEEMEASMVKNLEEKTGKSLAAWLKIAGKAGCEKHGQLVKHLKSEHGVTHGYANLIAHNHFSGGSTDRATDDLVESQYSGPKAELRPIYDKLMTVVGKLGKDVEVAPKKAYVSLRRSKQFALIQPSTKTRVDVGINLKGVAPKGRLEASGSFNSMVSHRVRIEKPGDVDRELGTWLRQAYELA
jgi:hypothetical protein